MNSVKNKSILRRRLYNCLYPRDGGAAAPSLFCSIKIFDLHYDTLPKDCKNQNNTVISKFYTAKCKD